MIKLYSETTRLLCAPPGVESQVNSIFDVVDSRLEDHPPWRSFGFGSKDPTLIVRASLRTFVIQLAGKWEPLFDLNVTTIFSLAMLQIHEGVIVANVGPATIDYTEILVSDDNYRGRVDLQLLGDMRVFEERP